MIGFIQLTREELKNYSLVMVDIFSKWVEVYPTPEQDSAAVAKILL